MKSLTFPDKPDWPEIEADWKAEWIWTEEEAGKNTYAYFRHVFILPEEIRSAVCRITAERSYNLWINDHWIGRGPVSSDPRWKKYDVYNLKRYLQHGQNVAAILAYYDGLDELLPHHAPAAVLLQIDLEREDNKRETIYTNGEWKGLKSPAWDTPSWMDYSRLDDVSFQEIYYAKGEPPGWKTLSFNDISWPEVRSLRPIDHIAGFAAATPRYYPWVRLDPRPIAYQETKKMYPYSVFKIGEVKELEEPGVNKSLAARLSLEKIEPLNKAEIINVQSLGYEKSGPAVIQNSSATESYSTFDGVHAATIVFDFGRLMNARLGFEAEGEEGAAIDIGYAWRLIDGKVMPRISERNYYADRYILRLGRQAWQTYNWRHFRYVQLTFRNLTQPLKLHSLWAEETMYPFKKRGHFTCSDGKINRIWDMCEKTIRLCTDDRFMDAPGREKRQYTADLSQILLANYAFFGDLAIVRKYFRQIAQGQEIYGQYRVCNPGTQDDKGLIEASLVFVLRIWEHYQFFGDISLLKEMASGVWLFLEYCRVAENKRGLLEKLPCPIWIDWAFIDKSGENLFINALYSKALIGWSELYQTLGELDKAGDCKERGERIQQIFPDYFWNDTQKSFMDSKSGDRLSNHKSEHSQAVALLWADISRKRFDKIVKNWRKNPESFSRAEPLFPYFPFALSKYGRTDLALGIIRDRFGLFIREGLETCAETWCLLGEKFRGKWQSRASRAVAHGSSAWPAFFLLTEVLGIKPGAPGFKTVRIYPQLGGLKWAQGKFPANFGNIEVKISRQGRRWRLFVKLPEPRPLEIVMPFESAAIKEIFINRKPAGGLLSKKEIAGTLLSCLALPETKKRIFNISVFLRKRLN